MTNRNRETLTLSIMATINEAWEQGATLVDLAAANGVTVHVLRVRLRYYLGFDKSRVMPTVHQNAVDEYNKAVKEDRLKEYQAKIAAITLPQSDSKGGVGVRPYYQDWLRGKINMTNDLEHSVIAQLIEVGLLARYGNRDPKGLQWARQAVLEELRQKGWTLPPYTGN